MVSRPSFAMSLLPPVILFLLCLLSLPPRLQPPPLRRRRPPPADLSPPPARGTPLPLGIGLGAVATLSAPERGCGQVARLLPILRNYLRLTISQPLAAADRRSPLRHTLIPS